MLRAFENNPRHPLETVNYCSQCTCEDCRLRNVFGHCSKCPCCTGKFELQDNNDWNKHEDTAKHKDLSSKGSDAYGSPRKRIRTLSVASSARGAVDKIAGGNLCLITLQSKAEGCLELCHVMPRSLDDKSLTQLEYAWRMKYRSLYLDSRYNMLNLTSGLHGSFDSNHWAFLPLDTVLIARLQKWSISKVKGSIESFYKKQKQEVFSYAFLPLGDMDTCIARRNEERLQEPPSKMNLPRDHYFPYDTLPPLKSHIRPHFVIVNLMCKVRDLEEKIGQPITECEELSNFFEEHPNYEVILRNCELLFNAWMEKVVPDHFGRINPPSLVSSGGGEGYGKAGEAAPRGGRDQHNKSGDRQRNSCSHVSASCSEGKNVGKTRCEQQYHGIAFPANVLEERSDIWNGDQIGLRPMDSVTYTSSHGHEGTDDVDEPTTIEESDSAFHERVSRWVASIHPTLISPCDEAMLVGDEQMTDLLFDRGQHDSDGSPTMVGTLLPRFNDRSCSIDPALITTQLLGKADLTTSQPNPIDAAFVDSSLVLA